MWVGQYAQNKFLNIKSIGSGRWINDLNFQIFLSGHSQISYLVLFKRFLRLSRKKEW